MSLKTGGTIYLNRDWAEAAKRGWPLLAILGVAFAIAIWAIARRDDAAPTPEGATATATAKSDSVVRLDTAGQRLAGVEIMPISPNTSGLLIANGTITYDANRVAVISSRLDGRVTSVRADLGQAVPAGATLAIVESPEVAQIRGDLERARVSVEIARRNFEREKRLFEQSITPQKEMLAAEGDFRSAEADYSSAASRLRAVGASAGAGAAFGLVTPVSGTVVERNVSPGQMIGPSTNVFTVADLTRVWITVDVYERDLPRVRAGATATVEPTSLPGESFFGRVTYAGGVVDTSSRTFKVRVELSNAGLRLRPGMFAQVRIQTVAGGVEDRDASSATFVVPEIAVQEIGGKSVVFVATEKAGEYSARSVTIGPRAGGGMITITDGLRVGDRLVTKGAFQLKAELTKASFSEEG